MERISNTNSLTQPFTTQTQRAQKKKRISRTLHTEHADQTACHAYQQTRIPIDLAGWPLHRHRHQMTRAIHKSAVARLAAKIFRHSTHRFMARFVFDDVLMTFFSKEDFHSASRPLRIHRGVIETIELVVLTVGLLCVNE